MSRWSSYLLLRLTAFKIILHPVILVPLRGWLHALAVHCFELVTDKVLTLLVVTDEGYCLELEATSTKVLLLQSGDHGVVVELLIEL